MYLHESKNYLAVFLTYKPAPDTYQVLSKCSLQINERMDGWIMNE